MARLFGTDGVRGVANTELTCELAYRLGQAGAAVLASNVRRPTILVGRDTRISGEMLESALVAGICSVGARPVLVGVLPTPGIAYLTRYYEADAGVVISASHNTVEYNGIKYFDRTGCKLPDAIEDKIESIIRGETPLPPLPQGVAEQGLDGDHRKPAALVRFVGLERDRIDAVSYTHLDVYKRQDKRRRLCPPSRSCASLRGAVRRSRSGTIPECRPWRTRSARCLLYTSRCV